MNNTWSTGLCGCFEDCGSCMITYFCPCITMAQNQALVADRETTCLDYVCAMNVGPGAEYFIRQQIRSKYGFEKGEECGDCCVILFCTPLAICQHNRELKKRQGLRYQPVPQTQTMYH